MAWKDGCVIMADNSTPQRIVVEVFSHEEAARIRAEMLQLDTARQNQIQALERRIQGLHQTLYEALERISQLQSRS